ncbi:uncharacterized protein V1510DRAFT_311813 [Dipodascopsis tothii]|uniref:uncharacterized protein n=1 Tax=Dipodascopsis tothii TaxID=44089 RepID=UPI0034CFAD14
MAPATPPAVGPGQLPPRTSSLPSSCSIAINPTSLVINECITVTSAMRKNARWAQSGVASILGTTGTSLDMETMDSSLITRLGIRGRKSRAGQDNPLMANFTSLRASLSECQGRAAAGALTADMGAFDTPALFHPFLQVIRSSSITGPITSLALNAITKFLAYRIITPSSPRLPLAMQLLSSAITHCRFEASDSAQDEVVLLRILHLMELMMNGTGGDLLSDESVCEMMETGLSMCCQMRLSEMLRRSAEMAMVSMCQRAFELLKQIDPSEEPEHQPSGRSADPNSASVQMGEPAVAPPQATSALDTPSPGPDAAAADAADGYADIDVTPYGLPSIRELLRVLVSLLNPHDRQHTDTMRVMALRIIDVAFEVAGSTVAAHPSLRAIVVDDLCRYLVQLVRYDSPQILQTSLRVTSTVLHTMRPHLKLQQELLLTYLVACLHPRAPVPREPGVDPALYEGVPSAPKAGPAGSGASTPVAVRERARLGAEAGVRSPDARETMVESLSGLVKIPSYMLELFVNYDCDTERPDLCEDLVGLLSRNAFPDAAAWSTPNVPPLCLDALLSLVAHIAGRLDLPAPAGPARPPLEQLQRQRAQKQLVIEGAALFNSSPADGLRFLADHGVIQDRDDPRHIAAFLRRTSRVSKQLLGEFLAKPANKHILDCFIDSFNFADKRIDVGLRELLESFRLPGESQQIERIVEKFSERYTEHNTADVASKDAAFVLSYSVIMLNTDLHNPQVKSRMTAEQYKNNLRKVNDNRDFAPEYLDAIYDAIKHNEIIMPEEHDNEAGFEYAWKELLQKAHATGPFHTCDDTNAYDAELFRVVWRPIVSTLAYVFASATDGMVFERMITGFDHCARIAARYELPEVLDHIVLCLSKISTLTVGIDQAGADSTEIQVDGSSITVSPLSIEFGRNFKAQLATVVLFSVVQGNERLVRAGWQEIVHIWLNLFANSLISPYFSELQSTLAVPPIPMITPGNVIKKNDPKDSSILSTLSSYLSSYAVDGPPEPSDEELECTLSTVDCINTCKLSSIFDNIAALSSREIDNIIEILLRDLMVVHQRRPWLSLRTDFVNDPSVEGGLGGTGAASLGRAEHAFDGAAADRSTYAPLGVYVLEMATCLAIKDEPCVAALHEKLVDKLVAVLANSKNVYPLVVGRVACYLLAVWAKVAEYAGGPGAVPAAAAAALLPRVMRAIAAVDDDAAAASAVVVAAGLAHCFDSCALAAKKQMADLDDGAFWTVLTKLQQNLEAAPLVFAMLDSIVPGDDERGAAEPAAGAAQITLEIIDSPRTFRAAIALLGAFASAGSIGSEWEQKLDLMATARRSGRPTTPSFGGAAKGAPPPKADRRTYSALSAYGSPTVGVLAQAGDKRFSSSDDLKAAGRPAGKKMTAAEVNAAVAAGTYFTPGRPYADVVERAVKAVHMINDLYVLAPKVLRPGLTHDEDTWNVFWFPILDGLLEQCLNPCREIRQQAFGSLQRSLLTPELAASYDDFRWTEIFGQVLFPLIAGLLRPEVYQSDPRGMGETRLQAASLLCKVFLHYLEQLSEWDGMLSLWLKILDMMDRLMNSGQRDNLEEAVEESLKNVLLVMSSSQYLVAPDQAAGDDKKLRLWAETWAKLERFLPKSTMETFDLLFVTRGAPAAAPESAPAGEA